MQKTLDPDPKNHQPYLPSIVLVARLRHPFPQEGSEPRTRAHTCSSPHTTLAQLQLGRWSDEVGGQSAILEVAPHVVQRRSVLLPAARLGA